MNIKSLFKYLIALVLFFAVAVKAEDADAKAEDADAQMEEAKKGAESHAFETEGM